MKIIGGVVAFVIMLLAFVGVMTMAFTDWEPTQRQIAVSAFLALVYGAGARVSLYLNEDD